MHATLNPTYGSGTLTGVSVGAGVEVLVDVGGFAANGAAPLPSVAVAAGVNDAVGVGVKVGVAVAAWLEESPAGGSVSVARGAGVSVGTTAGAGVSVGGGASVGGSSVGGSSVGGSSVGGSSVGGSSVGGSSVGASSVCPSSPPAPERKSEGAHEATRRDKMTMSERNFKRFEYFRSMGPLSFAAGASIRRTGHNKL
ncbi:hypothetical protein FBQ99_01300 [Chloroflexi bacterium CFX2]|nr:hypothetical protein [Chloroflexi bacterium CFX2]